MSKEKDNYFMNIAIMVSKASTCLRDKVGCIIVKDNIIIATGYNGAPSKTKHCEYIGCYRNINGIEQAKDINKCRGAHAEINALLQCSKSNNITQNATIYCTLQPCLFCTKAIINASIIRIVYKEPHYDYLSNILLNETNIINEYLQ
jgi:dCMP deaminase